MDEICNQILWGSPKHWRTSAPVGSHGYAREFAANGWQVLFISSPITPLHRFLASDKKLYAERKAIHKARGVWEETNKIWDYVPWSLAPSKQVPRLWLQTSLGDMDRAYRRKCHGTIKPSIVWIDSPEFGSFFEQYPGAFHILRIADRNQGLQSFNSKLIQYQRELAQRADLVIVTSFALEEEFRHWGIANLVRVPNGVDLRRFQAEIPPELPTELAALRKPVAVFAGMVDHWFDAELLARVAKMLPDVSFIIIGRVGIRIDSRYMADNIVFLGERPSDSIPAYLYHADVGIIPFKQNAFTDAINPVKYYEYIACGLPVVATNIRELQRIKEPVLLAADAEAFAWCIRNAILLPRECRKEYQQVARSASWSGRWYSIMQIVEQIRKPAACRK